MEFKLGSDPECMVVDRSGKLVSAIPLIKEGKGKGRPVQDGAILHDNVNVEFNTKPATTEEEFVRFHRNVLAALATAVAPHRLVLRAGANFPPSQLKDEEARIFGCEPDFDAWALAINKVPAGADKRPFRSIGGHAHIGKGDNKNLNEILDNDYGKCLVVKVMDMFLGLPFTFLSKDPSERARRKLYGRAGCHRPKEYGVEYRTLSSAWLTTPVHTSLVYRLTGAGLAWLASEPASEVLEDGPNGSRRVKALVGRLGGAEEIQRVINNCDGKAARQMFEKLPLSAGVRHQARIVDGMALMNLYKGWSL